jgi:hypothetical protein
MDIHIGFKILDWFFIGLRKFMYENVPIFDTWCFDVRTAWINVIEWCAVLGRMFVPGIT